MSSKVDMSLDDFVKSTRKFPGRKRSSSFGGGGGGGGGGVANQKPNFSLHQNGGSGPNKLQSDLRSILAKKQLANITDLRAKLKPKALYTKKLASRSQSASNAPEAANGNAGSTGQGRKQLKLTSTFKSSVSSAVAGSSSRVSKSSSRVPQSRRSDPGPISHKHKSSSKLPSYEEAKKISVTVPGVSRPATEYSSQRREERLASQIARSKDLRQESYARGREEFLASTITSAIGGGSSIGGGASERDRGGVGLFGKLPLRGYPSRSPSPPLPMSNYGSFDSGLYSLGSIHSKAAPPPPPPPPPPVAAYQTGGSGSSRPRGITTATSMIISNLSDTVSKNDVAELCSVVGVLDGVYMHAPGVAEVVFKYKDDALEAFKKYNQRNLDGQPMHCKLQPASRSRLTAVPVYGHSYADDFYSRGFY